MNRSIFSVLVLATTAFFSAAVAQTVPRPAWQPKVQTSWQWQLTTPVDLNVDAEMFDNDLFNNSASVISAIHAKGRKAVCYISAGTWERGRPDSSQFPDAVKGKRLADYPSEKWLDVRRWDLLGPIMSARLDLCKAKGFDGVELDNVDAYSNRSGFPLTYQDQIQYNMHLASAAHARGLSAGLKNDVEQIRPLVPYFDWAINEQCYQYRECDDLKLFIAAGKPVFHVEYEMTVASFCPYANGMNFNSLKKNYDLDAYRAACRITPISKAAATPDRPATLFAKRGFHVPVFWIRRPDWSGAA